MRILYIHQYFNTPSMPGSTRSYEFAKRLVSRGDTVYLITSNWQGKSNLPFSQIDGINVYWSPVRYSNSMSYFRRIITFISFIWYSYKIGKKLDFDLIVASSTPLTVCIPAVILKRLKNVKMIFEVRDLWPDLPIAIGAIKSKIGIKILKIIENLAYNNSNHIICLSTGMEKELRLKNIEKKITVITNLSDIKRFNSIKISEPSLDYFEKMQGKKFVVYAGSFGRINGLEYLIDIATEINKINFNINFLLFGNGYEKDKIEKKAMKNNLLNKTIFINDYLPKKLMPKLLSLASVSSSFFIDVPEMENNSANKFFDGLAAGKPIMINYKGWQADLLINYNAGFLIPYNQPKQAAEKLNKILLDQTLLDKMSKESKKLANQFDIEVNYKKFENVIDQTFLEKRKY